MHDVGIVVAREDISGSAHVGRQLVQLVEPAIDRGAAVIGTPEVADDEIVGLGVAEFGKLEIDPADPEAFTLQAADQVTADEPAGPADEGFFLQ